jgi:hypothetical protein
MTYIHVYKGTLHNDMYIYKMVLYMTYVHLNKGSLHNDLGTFM